MTRRTIRDEIRLIFAHPGGVVGRMRDYQVELGRTLVPLGAKLPFPVPHWDWKEALIAVDDRFARIIMVESTRHRRGALTRLVKNIKAAGLIPVICAPMGKQMPAILEHWGWIRLPGNEDEWVEPVIIPPTEIEHG